MSLTLQPPRALGLHSGFSDPLPTPFRQADAVMAHPHTRTTVLVADRLPILANGLVELLRNVEQFNITGQPIKQDRDLIELSHTQPDILVFDPTQTSVLPSALVHLLCQDGERPALIGFCTGGSLDLARNCLDAGFRGFLSKMASVDQIARALRVVCEGGVYLDEAFAKAMLSAQSGSADRLHPQTALSEREEFVLKAIAHGRASKEIAGLLQLSPKTIDTYKARALQKLGLHGRTSIIRHAIHMGWMQSVEF